MRELDRPSTGPCALRGRVWQNIGSATIPFSIPSLPLPHIVNCPFPGQVQGRDLSITSSLNAQGAPFCLWQPRTDVAGPCAHSDKVAAAFQPRDPAEDPQTTVNRAPLCAPATGYPGPRLPVIPVVVALVAGLWGRLGWKAALTLRTIVWTLPGARESVSSPSTVRDERRRHGSVQLERGRRPALAGTSGGRLAGDTRPQLLGWRLWPFGYAARTTRRQALARRHPSEPA